MDGKSDRWSEKLKCSEAARGSPECLSVKRPPTMDWDACAEPHLSAEPLMSRRQVSICTSRPRFMLHISIYSCRCRFMSLLAVASSSWKESMTNKGDERGSFTSGYCPQQPPSSIPLWRRHPGPALWYQPSLFSAHQSIFFRPASRQRGNGCLATPERSAQLSSI